MTNQDSAHDIPETPGEGRVGRKKVRLLALAGVGALVAVGLGVGVAVIVTSDNGGSEDGGSTGQIADSRPDAASGNAADTRSQEDANLPRPSQVATKCAVADNPDLNGFSGGKMWADEDEWTVDRGADHDVITEGWVRVSSTGEVLVVSCALDRSADGDWEVVNAWVVD